MTNTNPTSLATLLVKYMEPVPFLGCIGKVKEDAEENFFDIGYKYLKSNPDKDTYIGCFITDEGIDYYTDTDELPVYMCTSYKYSKLTKVVKRRLKHTIKSTLFYVFNKLKTNGIEVSWNTSDRNVFYICDQHDLESASVYPDEPVLQEAYVSSVYEQAKSLGVDPEVTSKYIDLMEALLSGGLYPWELSDEQDAIIANLYNKDRLLYLNVHQLNDLITKVRNGQYRLR